MSGAIPLLPHVCLHNLYEGKCTFNFIKSNDIKFIRNGANVH